VTPEQYEAAFDILQDRLTDLARRVRYLEKLIDTKDSPWWKRLAFRLDGWPAWYRVGPRSWRPWHMDTSKEWTAPSAPVLGRLVQGLKDLSPRAFAFAYRLPRLLTLSYRTKRPWHR
jgi:hypothetical protein